MHLSGKSQAILDDMFAKFREEYANRNPGSSENDAERAFLTEIAFGMRMYGLNSKDILERIRTL